MGPKTTGKVTDRAPDAVTRPSATAFVAGVTPRLRQPVSQQQVIHHQTSRAAVAIAEEVNGDEIVMKLGRLKDRMNPGPIRELEHAGHQFREPVASRRDKVGSRDQHTVSAVVARLCINIRQKRSVNLQQILLRHRAGSLHDPSLDRSKCSVMVTCLV